MGPDRRNLGVGVRVIFHGAYAIYYAAQPDALVILRVLHGSRDIRALATQGGFR